MNNTQFKKFKRYIDKRKDYSEYKNHLFLEQNHWDDYGYETLFEVYMPNEIGKLVYLGSINIANLEAEKINISDEKVGSIKKYKTFEDPQFKDEFKQLNNNFISLGNERFYIELHKNFNSQQCESILTGLNDLAVLGSSINDELWNKEIVSHSLLRPYKGSKKEAEEYIKHTLNPVAIEGKRNGYDITYSYFSEDKLINEVNFVADPEEVLPQNIHAIIGNNGVGKTTFFKDILLLAANKKLKFHSGFKLNDKEMEVRFSTQDDIKIDTPNDYFSKILFISFSPFDKLTFQGDKPIGRDNIDYLGLYKKGKEPLRLEELKKEYESIVEDLSESRDNLSLFVELISKSNAFPKSFIPSELNLDGDLQDLKSRLKELFNLSSSGQKIVILSISKLILETKKYSLVLIDEPELFLHPPLVSNFIRAISEIMERKNGFCLLTTHSPIIIQELPKDCVKIMEKDERGFFKMSEPPYQTFGENLSTLTTTIFKLDQYNSGFYLLIKDIINTPEKYGLTDEELDSIDLGRDASLFRKLLMMKRDDK